jgi:hypothetical protein
LRLNKRSKSHLLNSIRRAREKRGESITCATYSNHIPALFWPALKRRVMEILVGRWNGLFMIIVLLFLSGAAHSKEEKINVETKTCPTRRSPCFYKKMKCPAECPTSYPKDPTAKVCYVNCNSPICKAECKSN